MFTAVIAPPVPTVAVAVACTPPLETVGAEMATVAEVHPAPAGKFRTAPTVEPANEMDAVAAAPVPGAPPEKETVGALM
jgi:hypothetical protein